MIFSLAISMANAAFDGPNGPAELNAIIRKVGARIHDGYDSGKCMDSAGHFCGEWEITRNPHP